MNHLSVAEMNAYARDNFPDAPEEYYRRVLASGFFAAVPRMMYEAGSPTVRGVAMGVYAFFLTDPKFAERWGEVFTFMRNQATREEVPFTVQYVRNWVHTAALRGTNVARSRKAEAAKESE